MQTNPYLRMARPGKEQDNIGYHRDTYYGTSPYELFVLIPYVDVPAESALKVISGSHIHFEMTYLTTRIDHPNPEIYKGSKKHQVGFLYSPKVMQPQIEEQMEPVPLKVGQALLFSLAIVHGSRINLGKTTRWSLDVRVRSTYAPVEMGERVTSYETVHNSVVTHCANQYFEANKDDPRDKDKMELCIQHLSKR